MSKKILIVDDDPDSLKLIELMLQRRGYDVVSAQSGSEALQDIKTEKPDLIILDVMMPGMDGHQVCRELRANAHTAHLPVIMFTAKSLVGDKVAGFQAGADDYLTKPIHPVELVSHVQALLQRSELAREEKRAASQARVIGVIGAKGGVGTTTLAVNLAVAACQNDDLVRVNLADLHSGLGGVVLLLGGETQQGGLAALMSLNPDNLDQETVEQQIVTHACGLHYLPAPLQPESEHGHLLVDHADAILSRLTSRIGFLFLDLGSVLDESTRHALERCNVVLVTIEPSRLCLILAKTMLDEIGMLASPPADLRVVLIEHSASDTQYNRAQIENLLGRKPEHTIQPAPELARQAIEQGTPVVLMQPESVLARQLSALSQELLAQATA